MSAHGYTVHVWLVMYGAVPAYALGGDADAGAGVAVPANEHTAMALKMWCQGGRRHLDLHRDNLKQLPPLADAPHVLKILRCCIDTARCAPVREK